MDSHQTQSAILLSIRNGGTSDVKSLFTRKELVGKGAYGGVYKGVHNPTGTVVALKVIDLDTPDDDISEIQKEVALLSEMRDAARHNITLYHGSYLSGHELWIAMDFASGGSIRTLARSIDEKYIVLIVREILVALSFLHRQNIIHRDVKAANILLTQVGKILLADFGVAAHLQTNNKRSTFIGTPLWMAPEVITDGKLYDTKADIWSLGVTIYEIATGNPPYFGMEPLRACALIPRQEPAKLEGGNWSLSMRDFLAMCLQMDPTCRPTADELMKTKWIKSASKTPLSLLKELIVRYVGWIQSGGQRASLAGMDSLVEREHTFEIDEDAWDFGSSDEFDVDVVEPLGDEPPRSLDAQAAISNIRPPKPPTMPRNHPLMRLFDTESNPYAQPAPQPLLSMPSGAASMDTVKPMISIPSFEEMDEMAGPETKVIELPKELISPASATPLGDRPSPFSWLNGGQPSAVSSFSHHPSREPSSPFLSGPNSRSQTPDSMWGASATTPTDATFRAADLPNYPVHSSPSLPSMPFQSSTDYNRPFTPSRKRADTAPSYESPLSSSPYYPPPPTGGLVFSSHSANPSVSSISSNGPGNFSFASASSSSTSLATMDSPPSISRPFGGQGFESIGGADVNRPFRERQGSDAAFRMGGRQASQEGRPRGGSDVERERSGTRSRAGSDARPSGLHPRPAMKLQISTNGLNGNGLPTPTPTNGTPSPFFTPTSASFSQSTFDPETSPTSTPTPQPSSQGADAFPFPPVNPSIGLPSSAMFPPPLPWPTGPPMRPLDYGKLTTAADVHSELESTIGELGKWLEVVDTGLGRILAGSGGIVTGA
ncbi:protein-serine/threonine kinase [Pseudohyphozyma bogoriensis]|nr:protein-serine/threonine kinase [Pseudohyphozyma bogoriensis]